jgi:hypothetical protein
MLFVAGTYYGNITEQTVYASTHLTIYNTFLATDALANPAKIIETLGNVLPVIWTTLSFDYGFLSDGWRFYLRLFFCAISIGFIGTIISLVIQIFSSAASTTFRTIGRTGI